MKFAKLSLSFQISVKIADRFDRLSALKVLQKRD